MHSETDSRLGTAGRAADMRTNGEHDRLVQESLPEASDLHTSITPLVFNTGQVEADTLSAPIVKKVLLVASAGGHWIELCRLGAAFRDWDCQYVSTARDLKPPLGDRPVLQISDSSRENLGSMIRSIGQLRRIIRLFQPHLVVSTGAAPGALALLLAKLHGARTIWIDSIANSEELSLSGHAVRPVADLRLTQWPHLAAKGRSIAYFGQVL